MKHRKFALLTIMILMIVMLGTVAGNCSTKLSNEETPLVIAIGELDGVFSPFFATSGYDSQVVGMTQIGMLDINDKNQTDYGDEVSTVVRYAREDAIDDRKGEQITNNVRYEDLYHTTYSFVIKNDIMFADGVELTYKDVLFNLYMYLDPVYNGSNTLYSTDILGLEDYRTQEGKVSSADIQEAAQLRVSNFLKFYSHDIGMGIEGTSEEVIRADYAELKRAFREEELNSDWAMFAAGLDDYIKEYTSVQNKKLVTEVWQAYLINWGAAEVIYDTEMKYSNDPTKYLSIDYGAHTAEIAKIKSQYKKKSAAELEAAIKEYCITVVFNNYFASEQVFRSKSMNFVTMTATGSNYSQYVSNEIRSEKLAGDKVVPSVEGITVERLEQGATFVDNLKGVSLSGEDTAGDDTTENEGEEIILDEAHYVVKIRIYGVDPKALLSFGFTVAPMHYYSNPSTSSGYTKQDGYDGFGCFVENELEELKIPSDKEEHFGFPYADVNYMNKVIKSVSGLPMGAGIYQPSNSRNDENLDNVTALNVNTGFYSSNIVYYTRNPHFESTAKSPEVHNAVIRRLRYSVTNSTRLFDAVKTGTVHFADPSAKPAIVTELSDTKGDLKSIKTRTNGYGYIGINARYVPDLEIRRAIMHAMDTSRVTEYYPTGYVENIYRPISRESWAYPDDITSPYYDSRENNVFSDTKAIEIIKQLRTDAGYTLQLSNGVYYNKDDNSKVLDYTFTIAGATTDHPAFQTMQRAAKLLEQCGFKIKVSTNPFALRELASGRLAVWAAAWNSSLDPDMYQVYHMDSQATSILAWGYPQILGLRGETAKGSTTEKNIITDLSKLIDDARKITHQATRKAIYAQALNKVMELAVELPTYQRYDLYVYKSSVIDESTIIPEEKCTSFRGPLSNLWKVSFVNG